MATSGSFNFNLFIIEIIEAARRKLGIWETPSAEEVANGKEAANAMIKGWRSIGKQIWDVERVQIAIRDPSIVNGSDGLDYECLVPHISDTTNEPRTGVDYLAFWTELSSTTAPAWVTSTSYVSKSVYDLENQVVSVDNVRLITDKEATVLDAVTRREFFDLGRNTSEGKPNQFYFQRGNEFKNPQIYFSPAPDTSADLFIIELDKYTFFEDFVDNDNNPDLPSEWLETLIYSLAVRLGPEYPAIPLSKMNDLERQANIYLNNAVSLNEEEVDLQITPKAMDFNSQNLNL